MNTLLFVLALKTKLLLSLYISVVPSFKNNNYLQYVQNRQYFSLAVNNGTNSNASAVRYNSPFFACYRWKEISVLKPNSQNLC